MRLSIFGLGYVGCVSAACFADAGHQVVGVDVNDAKVSGINGGECPIVEPGLDALIRKTVASGALRATTSPADGVAASDVALVCVGTPSRANGGLDIQYVLKCCEEIGAALRTRDSYFLVVIRSTVLPGTCEDHVRPALERASGKRAGVDFGLCMNPEFLREGTSLKDFYDPPYTVIGELDARSGDLLTELYTVVQAPLYRTNLPAAEMLKYANNAFHGLKVAFANEIGNLCKKRDIDSHALMEIFCQDTKLNLSPYYLKPGFAFGGSCLPKDLRAITYHARQQDVDVPVLDSVLRSNHLQITGVIDHILRLKRPRVGVLGLSFKAGTDDLRESPMVVLTETLLGKGLQIRIFDGSVQLSRLIGANKRFIEQEIPHIAQLLRDSVDAVLAESDVVVVGNRAKEFLSLADRLDPRHLVIDLVRAVDGSKVAAGRYWGICW